MDETNEDFQEESLDPALLSMSDDDLSNMDLDAFLSQAGVDTTTTEPQPEGDESLPSSEGNGTPVTEGEGEDTDTDEEDEDEDPESEEDEGKPTDSPTSVPDQPASEEQEAATPEEGTATTETEVDYKAAYEQLTAPFRANGRDIKVDSVEEAVTLMQMGANYNKKMAALKPNLKLMKLMENNGLLNEEEISFLIDLKNKNPQAIGKLLKDSGLDPLEMDVAENGYTPKTYTVDDRELELDEVLGDIQDTPQFSRTIDVVTNKFDGKSKQIVADNPQLLKVLNTHVESGIYDLISTEVDRARMLGRLNGLSDLEAYKQIGDAMEQRGAFAQLVQDQRQVTPPQRVVAPVPAKPKVDPALNSKKRAASPTKAATPAPAKEDFNPLAMSDDEFEKINMKLM